MRDRADFEGYVAQRSDRLLRTAYLLCRDWGAGGGPDCAPAPENAPRPSPGVTITPVYPTAGAPSGGG
ncbi:hypothetical protein [Streptosporangium saharense]|uniref:Uncharacterized protein n=1 Tax=Streptosporangium saharense TaxID=1706840 RepID=A0A7W7QN58_9ACTN|nr:hypothetical protein [Streptosporangium saharense]MBB4916519.1 hypothetical protein [Streptosporangium saharense]